MTTVVEERLKNTTNHKNVLRTVSQENVSWRVTRSVASGKLHGVRCGWYSDEDGMFNAVKAITPNGDIVFHSADMADIAIRMIKSYQDIDLADLPISAYIKVGTSAVKIFSGSFEFANAFYAHWQGTSVIQNLILVHSGSTSDDFMLERCACYNSGDGSLLANVRELFAQSTDLSAEQRRVNQLRVDLTSQCIVNKLVLEDRGIISSWRKVCEIFGFKGARINATKNLGGMSVRRIKNGKPVESNSADASMQKLHEYFSSDITKFESMEKVDLFEQAKLKQSKLRTVEAQVDLTTSGLYSDNDIEAASKRLQQQISNINRTRGLPDGYKFKVTHLKENSEVFVLQVLTKNSLEIASIPLKSITSVKAMSKMIVKDFKCNDKPSFIDGIKSVCLTLCNANGYGREEPNFFVGTDEQIEFFCNEWQSGVFSSLIAIKYSGGWSTISIESIKHRINSVKVNTALVHAEQKLGF